jgi:hypothetical protein
MILQGLNSEHFLNELKQATDNNANGFDVLTWANKLSIFLNAL